MLIKKYKKYLLYSLFLFLFPGSNVIADGDYILEIQKSNRILFVKKNGRVHRTFRVSLGKGGAGDKSKSGDKITPVGTYKISYYNDESRFHFFMQINYPNAKDALHGLKNKTIDRDTFSQIVYAQQENRVPDQKTDLGGALGIHGIGEETDEKLDLHRDENWTNGCIAMKNEEIEELRNFVHIGTTVVIFD